MVILKPSPHTRGPRRRCYYAGGQQGIIPAYAGSTDAAYRSFSLSWDHPRIRGVHSLLRSLSVPSEGSSPHTRGSRTRTAGRCRRCRIIPAYAGSTEYRRRSSSRRQDHPRIRGVHRNGTISSPLALGSSPHTRGPQMVDKRDGGCIRIIPAYAGSTETLQRPDPRR